MAKRKAAPARKALRKRQPARRKARRSLAKRSLKRPVKRPKKRPAVKRRAPAKPAKKIRKTARKAVSVKVPRLDRVRRTLDEMVQSPPSSLDMVRRGTAARTGRAETAESVRNHHGMEGVVAGELDVDVEDAYFTGDGAPGGDNPTPDQDLVDDIGKSLGVQYEDNEELKGAEKLESRDKHRWELDPASSDDYKDRK